MQIKGLNRENDRTPFQNNSRNIIMPIINRTENLILSKHDQTPIKLQQRILKRNHCILWGYQFQFV